MNVTEGWCPGSKAAYFSHNSSFATVLNINISNCDFTIAFWIKSFGIDGPIIAFRTVGGKLFYVAIRNSIIFLSVYNTLAKADFRISDWNHIVITCEQFKIKVFLNGIERELQETWNEYFFVSSDYGQPYCIIGNNPHFFKIRFIAELTTQSFIGSVMDLYVVGRALSLGEISRMFKGNVKQFIKFFQSIMLSYFYLLFDQTNCIQQSYQVCQGRQLGKLLYGWLREWAR